jgi:S1-C subfamily serine protease
VPSAGLEFSRPQGVDAAFDPPEADPEPQYAPAPQTVSPEQRAAFERPPGAPEFAPPPNERIVPQVAAPPPVPAALAAAFGTSSTATADGFDPAPGTRIGPSGPPAESPWWKADARRDPWRDPNSPYWLGRGAIFAGERPAQLAPEEDDESTGELPAEPAADETAPTPAKRARLGLSAVSLMLLVALIAGALGGGIGYWLTNRSNNLLHRSDVSLAKTGQPANRPPGSVADIAKRVGPAVVSIAVTTPTQFSLGSGVVIDKLGYVLTNNHVIDVGTATAFTIVVTFANEATAKAQVVGRDPTSDLAVLKVPTDQLTVAALGDSSKLAVGDPVIAIGSPLGLQGTVTEGIVSSLNRAVHISDSAAAPGVYLNAIQTDAAINLGNSGGALVDASGAVVGINSAAALGTTEPNGQQASTSGIGFAIPINYARDIAQQLIRTGKAVHASFGAQGRSVTANDSSVLGAYLIQVTPSGAADKAGLKVGDVVVVADGQPVQTYDQLVVVIQAHKPGDSIPMTYFRGAVKATVTVKLGSA